jgi:predicted cupin superfamily sugar epimerase
MIMADRAEDWIERLQLAEHPEGGYFRQTYRSSFTLPRPCLPEGFPGARPLATAIYYLLKGGGKSFFHRIKSDELWHHYEGGTLTVVVIQPDGQLLEGRLGKNFREGESFQFLAPAGCWFGAMVHAPGSYALVGCTVAPGFDFEDLELGVREELVRLYPQHRRLIESLTPASVLAGH